MTKNRMLPLLLGGIIFVLCACGMDIDNSLLTSADYEIDQTSGKSTKEIGVGDGYEAFVDAYKDYDLAIASVEAQKDYTYQSLAPSDIPFDQDIRIIVPTFFINDEAQSVTDICEANSIDKDSLLSLLTSSDFLANNKVVYKYLVFDFSGGVITNMTSEELDFNADSSYFDSLFVIQ